MGLEAYGRSRRLAPLFSADGLLAGDWDCGAPGVEGIEPPIADERAAAFEVTFVRRGAYRLETEGASLLADASVVVLLPAGAGYRVSHPAGCGDRCLVLAMTESTVGALLDSAAPALAERPERLFARTSLPSTPAVGLTLHRFLRRVEDTGGDPLAGAEAMLDLLAALFAAPAGAPPARAAPAGRRERVEAARLLLAARLGEAQSLDDLAAAVDWSPFHLARQFRALTGQSLHGVRTRLRLQAALERLAAGERDLTRLALDLGFFDHAHFSRVCKRHFGLPPSALRRELRGGRLPTAQGRRPRSDDKGNPP
jgi:AraC-like DNA-binding protein